MSICHLVRVGVLGQVLSQCRSTIGGRRRLRSDRRVAVDLSARVRILVNHGDGQAPLGQLGTSASQPPATHGLQVREGQAQKQIHLQPMQEEALQTTTVQPPLGMEKVVEVIQV